MTRLSNPGRWRVDRRSLSIRQSLGSRGMRRILGPSLVSMTALLGSRDEFTKALSRTATRAESSVLPSFRVRRESRSRHIGDDWEEDKEVYLISPRGGSKQWAPIYTRKHHHKRLPLPTSPPARLHHGPVTHLTASNNPLVQPTSTCKEFSTLFATSPTTNPGTSQPTCAHHSFPTSCLRPWPSPKPSTSQRQRT